MPGRVGDDYARLAAIIVAAGNDTIYPVNTPEVQTIRADDCLRTYYIAFDQEMRKVRKLLALLQQNAPIAQLVQNKRFRIANFFQFAVSIVFGAAPVPGGGAIATVVNTIISSVTEAHQENVNRRLAEVVSRMGREHCEYVARAVTIRYSRQILLVEPAKCEELAKRGVIRFLISILKPGGASHENRICNVRIHSYRDAILLQKEFTQETALTANAIYTKPGFLFFNQGVQPNPEGGARYPRENFIIAGIATRQGRRGKPKERKGRRKYRYFLAYGHERVALGDRLNPHDSARVRRRSYRFTQMPTQPNHQAQENAIRQAFLGIAEDITTRIRQELRRDIDFFAYDIDIRMKELHSRMDAAEDDIAALKAERAAMEAKLEALKAEMAALKAENEILMATFNKFSEHHSLAPGILDKLAADIAEDIQKTQPSGDTAVAASSQASSSASASNPTQAASSSSTSIRLVLNTSSTSSSDSDDN